MRFVTTTPCRDLFCVALEWKDSNLHLPVNSRVLLPGELHSKRPKPIGSGWVVSEWGKKALLPHSLVRFALVSSSLFD